MDCFKLLYEHDQRLESLRKRHTDRAEPDTSGSLEDFLKPDPTFSRFYFSGSRPEEERFGLTALQRAPEILTLLRDLFQEWNHFSSNGHNDPQKLDQTLAQSNPGDLILFSRSETPSVSPEHLLSVQDETMSHRSDSLKASLEAGERILFVEKAHHGIDLHLFSMENIYRQLFYPIQGMVTDSFRFFSMNGKRIRSERAFFFETWRMERPPHGIEEVFQQTVL
ncbi:MAG: hypothetical protein ACQER4_08920 [Bacteroidota bacterium]